MVEARRHYQLSVALTLLSILLTETVHHLLRWDPAISAPFFLLGLVPIAYGALRAGFLAGATSTAILALYALHYTGPHGALVSTSFLAWRSFAVVAALGIAMSWPMAVIHTREERFRAALESRTLDLQRRNEELTELNATLESFGYVVGHDLKEPVRAVENYLTAALEERGTPESERYVDEALEANRRLARMLDGILQYSRASNVSADLRALAIEDVLSADACRGQYERLYEERGAHLEILPGLPKVRGDETLLAQILGNILINAVRHNPREKPHVRIEAAEAAPGRAHLVVSDDGPGFPPEVMRRFTRLPESGVATVKTGFGLVIAQRAARRLDGTLWLENGPNGGACAHVDLPAA